MQFGICRCLKSGRWGDGMAGVRDGGHMVSAGDEGLSLFLSFLISIMIFV